MASAQASPESPICPSCQAPLALGANGLTGFWSCPNGHGVACTVTAAYGHVDEAEIRAIWQGSASATPGSHSCPMCGHPMVEVAAAAASAGAAAVPVDVCRDDELFWLDAGEVDQLPKDTPDAPLTAEQEHDLAAIRQTFDAAVDEGIRESNSGLFDRLAGRISQRHPGFTGMMDAAVYRGHAADLHEAPPAASDPPAA
jgi:Zn-finger nucleic acid-binding protein